MSSALRAPLMSLDEALTALLSQISPLNRVETVATLDADGRVLANDLVSQLQVRISVLMREKNSAIDMVKEYQAKEKKAKK